MKPLVLTGLGNEIELKTGRTVFTATFDGNVRIEISKEAAGVLTSYIYSDGVGDSAKVTAVPEPDDDYKQPPPPPEEEAEEFGGNGVGLPVLEDNPTSVYDDDTGVSQL